MVLDVGPNDTDVRGDRQTLWEGIGLQQVYTRLRWLLRIEFSFIMHIIHTQTHRILQTEDI
jgi:hypothetical protein